MKYWLEYLGSAQDVLRRIVEDPPSELPDRGRHAFNLHKQIQLVREIFESEDLTDEMLESLSDSFSSLYRTVLPDLIASTGYMLSAVNYSQGLGTALQRGGSNHETQRELEKVKAKMESISKTNKLSAKKPRSDYPKMREEYSRYVEKNKGPHGVFSALKLEFGWDPRTVKRALNEEDLH